MTVTDDQMWWLRAYLRGDLDEVHRLHAQAASRAESAGIGALVYAAFVVAARRTFATGWARADVTQFISRVRRVLAERSEDLDPVVAEQEMLSALGEKPARRGGVKSRGRAQFILLNALVQGLNLSDPDVAGLLNQARSLADQMLAAGTVPRTR